MNRQYIFSILKGLLVVSFLGLMACSSSGSGSSNVANISLTGTLSDVDGAPVVATITAKKASDDSVVSTTTSAADGSYTLAVLSGTEFYLTASATNYVPSNTRIVSLTADETGADIIIIDETSAGQLANLIDGSADWSAASSKSWVAFDFYYGSEDDGEGITATNASSIVLLYNHCDGTFGAGPTPTPACVNRMGPMAMGNNTSDANIDFTVTGTGTNTASTVNGGSKTITMPLRVGEITYDDVWIDD